MFSKKSISFQFLCLELSLIVLVIIAIIFTYFRTSNQIYQQNQQYVNDIINQIENNINTHLLSIDSISSSVAFNDDIKKLLIVKNQADRFVIFKKIEDYLTKMQSLKYEIKDIGVVGVDGVPYNIGYDPYILNSVTQYIKKLKCSSKVQYLGIIRTEDKDDKLVFGTNIFSEHGSLDRLGYVIVMVDINVIIKELKLQLGDYYLVDNNDNIVISSKEENLDKNIKEFDEVISTTNQWEVDLPLKIVGVNTKKQITVDDFKTKSVYLIIIGIMIFMIVLTYIFYSNYVVKPLNLVSKFISSISNGDLRNLKKRMKVEGSKEIQMITEEINYLLDEVNNLTHRLVSTTSSLYNIELEKKKSELNYLKSQVNPHFLYNTLGIIKGIAILKDEKEIERISSALVKIFKYSVKGEDTVKLSKEIEVAKAYLQIQSIRFQDRFDVEYQIEEHLLDMNIQKMILQPLIENAIFHGIEPTSKKSKIIIKVLEEEDGVRLCVIDNGIGIKPDILKKIQSIISADTVYDNRHIGMNNVIARLKYVYGDACSMTIESQINKGTTVCLFLPSDVID